MTRSPSGLVHPESLELWREWQSSRHPARRLKHTVLGAARRVRPRPEEQEQAPAGSELVVRTRRGEAGGALLLALDSGSPSNLAAVLSALPYLRSTVHVLAPREVRPEALAGDDWEEQALTGDPVAQLRELTPSAVLSLGHFLRAGELAHEVATVRDVPELVIQHGALTPYAPPLPGGATLLAWSDADGAFWRSGRSDVAVRTVGSQILWEAAHEPEGEPVSPDATPVFLGQMHGAELPRRVTAGAAYRFCRQTGAEYRPHPMESDVISRTAHKLFRRRGITFADTSVPLREVARPVVAVFSTGVLEAAVRGVPAWVYAPEAPAWVHEFWDRYGLRRWGGEPTPRPRLAADEPASLVAQALEGAA
ncbi:hypothetical protein JSY14_06225 [Brachybacterium sp. EF45031]|uniref:hypothetical protein n=1 Tax=Brachybacterium sillae TaxID=2810536 RepID=UPI00217DCF9C|nr:hypothetical protein [Brachybacterium sillae]MCS6711640.1 hypothetical protein [Brachybacterium sillae]